MPRIPQSLPVSAQLVGVQREVRTVEAADADVEDARLEPAAVVGRHGDTRAAMSGRVASHSAIGRPQAGRRSHEHDKHRDNNMTSVDSC